MRHSWANETNLDAIRHYYHAVWIYGDRDLYDPVCEYDLPDEVAAKVRYTGYLDQRPRLEFAEPQVTVRIASHLAVARQRVAHRFESLFANRFDQSLGEQDESGCREDRKNPK